MISQRNPLSRLENEALYERLKRAQRCRLEDQRGTEINTELPDFLKLPNGGAVSGGGGGGSYSGESLELPIDGRASEPILGCRPRLVYQVCVIIFFVPSTRSDFLFVLFFVFCFSWDTNRNRTRFRWMAERRSPSFPAVK